MVKFDRSNCIGCPHYGIVKTLNHPEGELSCKFALIPCDSCKEHVEIYYVRKNHRKSKKSDY